MKQQCQERVDVKDVLRLVRGRGFKMHYNEQQCSRPAQEGRDYCWQHPWAEKRLARAEGLRKKT